MYLLRFKQEGRPYRYLAVNQQDRFRLTTKAEEAHRWDSLEVLKRSIETMQALVIPKQVEDWTESILFLLQLYGTTWDDQMEGMLINMDDIVKTQILNEKNEVVKTIRLRCQVWEKHYA